MQLNQVKIPLLFVFLVWLTFIADFFIAIPLRNLGILPREPYGLIGILFAPFLHGNWLHLVSNTLPLFFLTLLLVAFFSRIAAAVMALSILFTGTLTWLFGRKAFHIGASGYIYAVFGFLIAAGWFRRDFKAIAISLAVIVFYGSMIWGVLPSNPWVSWESHLFGFISGISIAYLLKNQS